MAGLFFVSSLVFIVISSVIATQAVKRGKSGKKTLFSQMVSSCGFIVSFFVFLMTNVHAAAAAAPAAAAVGEAAAGSIGIGLIGVGLTMGLTAIGTGIAVASAAPAAIAANAENPKTFGKSMGLVAMGEGILVFGFVMSYLMLTKIDQIFTLLGV